jgi:hypothetical protein
MPLDLRCSYWRHAARDSPHASHVVRSAVTACRNEAPIGRVDPPVWRAPEILMMSTRRPADRAEAVRALLGMELSYEARVGRQQGGEPQPRGCPASRASRPGDSGTARRAGARHSCRPLGRTRLGHSSSSCPAPALFACCSSTSGLASRAEPQPRAVPRPARLGRGTQGQGRDRARRSHRGLRRSWALSVVLTATSQNGTSRLRI